MWYLPSLLVLCGPNQVDNKYQLLSGTVQDETCGFVEVVVYVETLS